MITSQQFDTALKTILEYKLQMENNQLILGESKSGMVDIQKNIKKHTFFILKYYFKDFFNEHLEWDDLKSIDLVKLKSIDLKHLRRYRGFGKAAELKFKAMIDTFPNNS